MEQSFLIRCMDMQEPSDGKPELTGRQKKILRSMGHHLEPTVYVGREGCSPPLIASLKAALAAHELVKIKLGANCPLERNEAALVLVESTGSSLIQIIGRTILLYRENTDIPRENRIEL